jgi:hypothetical protein
MALKGYFYSTYQEALNAVNLINSYEDIPPNSDTITKTFCEPLICEGGYYLPFNEVSQKYLTNEIDITFKTITL